MRINVLKSLLKKEFLNIIRDKKTFVTMILLPLLMFPLLVGMMTIMISSFSKIDNTITFGVDYSITEDFKTFVDNYSNNYDIEIIYDTKENLKEKFDNNDLGTYVLKNGKDYEIHFDENNTNTVATSSVVESIYEDYKIESLKNELLKDNINYDDITFNVTFAQESVTEMGTLIPSVIAMALIMIISSVCFSVSIDVTTSEKEKGTLETLLSLPVRKTELITSKYIVVFLLSCMSGFLTYISLFTTLKFAGNTLAMLGVQGIIIDAKTLIIYLISIILISLLFSGLLLSVTIFSKNLKEAQNSLYPLELMVTFVSMLPMFGVTASTKYSIIPFVNISLLFNNALSSNIDTLFVILTFLSTIVYSIILIIIVSKIYNQEEVLFSTSKINYLSFKNGKSKTTNFSVLVSLLLAVIIYLLAMYFSIMFINSSTNFLLSIMPLTIGLVIFVASMLVKLDYKSCFKLNKFHMNRLLSCIALYIGTYILATTVVEIVAKLFPSLTESFEGIVGLINIDNIWLAILIVALLPAIFEELLFRGVICSSFNKKYGMTIAIIVSSLAFGIYHMNWLQGIFAGLLGLLLGYSFLKSNSLFVPIIIHFINNLIAVLNDHYGFLNFEISDKCIVFLVISSLILVILAIFISEEQIKDKKS